MGSEAFFFYNLETTHSFCRICRIHLSTLDLLFSLYPRLHTQTYNRCIRPHTGTQTCTYTFGTVKPSKAAICEFLKALGSVLGISLLVHGAWLKSVTVSQHAFCIEHTSMTSLLETGAQAKFMERHTKTHIQTTTPSLFCLP